MDRLERPMLDGVDLAALLSRPIAHRGLHSPGGPIENSLSAVAAAINAGFGIEVDVQLSADNIAVIHHDRTLRRVCGVDRRVRDVSATDLRHTRLAGTDETVPTCRDVVSLVNGAAPLFLDLKCAPRRTERRALADQIAALTATYDGPVAVVGFDPLAIKAVSDAAPWIIRGQSGGVSLGPRAKTWATPATHPLDALWFSRISHPDFVSYNVERMPHTAVDKVRERMPIVGWTLRCTHKLRAMASSLDQVIVEGPAASIGICEHA